MSEFKVRDIVKRNANTSYPYWISNSNTIDSTFRVTDVDDSGHIQLECLNGDKVSDSMPEYHWAFDCFELVEETKKYEYNHKKGDVVKWIHHECFNLKRDDICVVEEDLKTNAGMISLKVLNNRTDEINDYNCVSYFEKVEADPCEEIKHSKENTMEAKDLKNFNPDNLAEGKKLAVEEQTNYELQEAKKVYTKLTDELQTQERVIREANEKVKELKKDLAVFGKKK